MIKLEESIVLKESNRMKIHDNSHKCKQNDAKYMNAIKPYIKERKNSKRQVYSSPYQANRSKSRKEQINHHTNSSQQKIEQTINPKKLSDMYCELVSLKAEYKSLKNSYNVILHQKNETTTKQIMQQQIQKNKKQIEKYKKNIIFLQCQIQRMKKQCYKLLQNQKFRNKKLEQTLQQKQLMIAYLRKQNQGLKNKNNNNNNNNSHIQNQLLSVHINQNSMAFLQNSAPIFTYDEITKSSQNDDQINNGKDLSKKMKQKHKISIQEDSLSFSYDNNKSKEMQSINSILSNNNNNNNNHDYSNKFLFAKKDLVVFEQSQDEKQQQQQHHYHQQQQQQQSQQEQLQNQQSIVTFENREVTLKTKKSQRNTQSKVNTKRLQICTDDIFKNHKPYGNSGRDDNSIENKKKYNLNIPHSHNTNNNNNSNNNKSKKKNVIQKKKKKTQKI